VSVATQLALDHLVVAARTLDEGVQWCEATLGITPGPGGRHDFMGTHNRLFAIGSPAFPRAYFEIIAIDGEAPPPARRRWFDLDDAALRRAIAGAPQLVHWVARTGDIGARCAALRAAGIDRGVPVAAQRDTPRGLLRWSISLRDDGARLCEGALPTLIEWGDVHPADTMPASGVVLQRLQLAGVPAQAWPLVAAPGVDLAAQGPALSATLATPRGIVVLYAPTSGSDDVQR
jgi:hypothetical protein